MREKTREKEGGRDRRERKGWRGREIWREGKEGDRRERERRERERRRGKHKDKYVDTERKRREE